MTDAKKPKILNFGSLNIDYVYQVDHFVQPGETLSCESFNKFAGGKGNNQSVALARAGAIVFHAGKVGQDGIWLKDKLEKEGVNVSNIKITESASGHAIIQVNKEGENSIIIHGGANQEIRSSDVSEIINKFDIGDYLLLQNEISETESIIRQGHDRGMKIILNPAPMDKKVLDYPLELVDYFIVNEIEGQQLTGESDPELIIEAMRDKFKDSHVVLTLGEKGAVYAKDETLINVAAEKVAAIDTTAAGDTFTGYFLALLLEGRSIESCIKTACMAAAKCVTKKGASDSIPKRKELN
jgi:ribokinase